MAHKQDSPTDGTHDRRPTRLKFRAIVPVIHAAGLVPWAIVFAALFFVGAFAITEFEPGIGGYGNAVWLMFQVFTTIGLGDFTVTTFGGRTVVALFSIYSIFYLALVTGAAVNYCSERMAARRDESVAHFLDQLEHLPELSHEELVELSNKVKRL